MRGFRFSRRRMRTFRRRPLCEIHVPAAPTHAFYSRIRVLAATIRRFGGSFSDSRIVVTVSRDREPTDLLTELPWSRDYPIEWRWMDRDLYESHGPYGTALQRFRYDFRSPVVLMLDADTICTGRLDELATLTDEGIGGVIAHISPFGLNDIHRDGVARTAVEAWADLYRAAALPEQPLSCQHTGWGFMDIDPSRRWCPPYFNLGVLAAPSRVMGRLGTVLFDELQVINRHIDTVFRAQLAVTLAIARTSTPWIELPIRFNFPNDPLFSDHYRSDEKDVRILHYLRNQEVDRDHDFLTQANLDALLRRTSLSPVNQLLQDRVAAVRAGFGYEVDHAGAA